jgi:hypothetical protein
MVMMKNQFKKLSIISVFAAAVSGCATMQDVDRRSSCIESDVTSLLGGFIFIKKDEFNERCAKEQAAREMLESNDVGLKAVGARVLSSEHGTIGAAADEVREKIKNAPMECTFTEVTGLQNKRTATMVCKPL